MKRFLSVGFGRQSSGVLVCSALGLHGVPRFDGAIFGDTMHELDETYSFAKTLGKWSEDHGIPVYTVCYGDLLKGILDGLTLGKLSYINFPAYYFSKKYNRVTCMKRQCTERYKIQPVRREIKRILGIERVPRGLQIELALGISIEEVHRMKPSARKWIKNIYPLVDARLRATDCQRIVMEAGLPKPSRSACDFCPFHDDRHWAYLKYEEPTRWEKCCAIDDTIRDRGHLFGLKDGEKLYLHKSLTPLRDLVLTREQVGLLQGFGGECGGYCGG